MQLINDRVLVPERVRRASPLLQSCLPGLVRASIVTITVIFLVPLYPVAGYERGAPASPPAAARHSFSTPASDTIDPRASRRPQMYLPDGPLALPNQGQPNLSEPQKDRG